MHICKPFDQFHKNNQIISNFIFLKNSTKREVLAVSSRWWRQELYASTHQGLGLSCNRNMYYSLLSLIFSIFLFSIIILDSFSLYYSYFSIPSSYLISHQFIFFFFLILFVQENCKTSYIYFLNLKFFIRFCII